MFSNAPDIRLCLQPICSPPTNSVLFSICCTRSFVIAVTALRHLRMCVSCPVSATFSRVFTRISINNRYNATVRTTISKAPNRRETGNAILHYQVMYTVTRNPHYKCTVSFRCDDLYVCVITIYIAPHVCRISVSMYSVTGRYDGCSVRHTLLFHASTSAFDIALCCSLPTDADEYLRGCAGHESTTGETGETSRQYRAQPAGVTGQRHAFPLPVSHIKTHYQSSVNIKWNYCTFNYQILKFCYIYSTLSLSNNALLQKTKTFRTQVISRTYG